MLLRRLPPALSRAPLRLLAPAPVPRAAPLRWLTVPAPSVPAPAPPRAEAPAIPERALAGVSPSFRTAHAARVEKGVKMPVIFANPGSHGQVARLGDAVIAALPPPAKPMWPMSEAELTWRYARAFSFGLLFAGLAVYLYARAALSGSGMRLRLERDSPWIAAALVAIGALPSLDGLGAGGASADGGQPVDRAALFGRVYARYAPPTVAPARDADPASARAPSMPLSRAAALVTGLHAATHTAGRSSPPSDVNALLVAGGVMASASAPPPAALTPAQFVALLTAASSDVPTGILVLAAAEVFSVYAAPESSLEALSDLYDAFVRGARPAGASFTPASLAELCSDIGWAMDEATAARVLRDCAAAAAEGGDSGSVATPVPMLKAEFVDALVACAASVGVTAPARLREYIRVFGLLHLPSADGRDSVRATAGVKGV